MAEEQTRSARQAQRAIRAIRLDSARTWRTWPRRLGAAVLRLLAAAGIAVLAIPRAIARVIAEVLAEVIPALIALGLFAIVSIAAAWGWEKSPAATVVFVAGFVAFVAFGAHELWFRHQGRRRGRIAALAAGTCVFVGIWVMYLVQYPSSLI